MTKIRCTAVCVCVCVYVCVADGCFIHLLSTVSGRSEFIRCDFWACKREGMGGAGGPRRARTRALCFSLCFPHAMEQYHLTGVPPNWKYCGIESFAELIAQ